MKTLLALLGALLSVEVMASSSVAANNKIGLKLALETSKARPGTNFMVSPISLQQALNLTGNGASGLTRMTLETLLGENIEGLNYQSEELIKDISFSRAQASRIRVQLPHATPAIVATTNSLWSTSAAGDKSRFKFSENYKSLAKEFYGAEILTADFKKQEGVNAINAWANKNTNGLVKQVIDLETLSNMLWTIVNATYIEANWREPFQKLGDQNFKTAEKQNLRVPMIGTVQDLQYLKTPEGEMVNVPFFSVEKGPALEMKIFLPGLSVKLEKSQAVFFDEAFLKRTQTLMARAQTKKIRLSLPRFSFDTSVSLKKDEAITKGVGLNFLFQDNAQFSYLATPDSFASSVGLIKQNTRVELDEKGIKAAAVTIVGGVRSTSVQPAASMEMKVDRPFLFAIVEKNTGAVIFAGTVIKP